MVHQFFVFRQYALQYDSAQQYTKEDVVGEDPVAGRFQESENILITIRANNGPSLAWRFSALEAPLHSNKEDLLYEWVCRKKKQAKSPPAHNHPSRATDLMTL